MGVKYINPFNLVVGMKRGRKKTKLKPREYAARLVAGDITLDQVPEKLQTWVKFYIRSMAAQVSKQ